MFGENKVKQREFFGVAWKKASQVWITGIATYEFEKKVYAGEIDPGKFGLMHPELIGWEGRPAHRAGRNETRRWIQRHARRERPGDRDEGGGGGEPPG